MEVYFNSKRICVEENISLHTVLEVSGVTTGSFAVAVNRQFVPRGQYTETMVNEGDYIDVVLPMQGG